MAAEVAARPPVDLVEDAVIDDADDGAAPPQPHLALMDPNFIPNVIKFLPIEEQLNLYHHVSRDLRASLCCDEMASPCWQALCENLCHQRRLWVPPAALDRAIFARARGGWQTLFSELWPLRNRFAGAPGGGDEPRSHESFRLKAYCRFRGGSQAAAPAQGQQQVYLPLHQRVRLMQQSHPELSRKEALTRVLAAANAAQGTEEGIWGKNHGSAGGGSADGFTASVLAVHPGADGSVLTVAPGCGLRNFEFGHVFDGSVKQEAVYEQCGLPLVTDFVNGVSGAMILYGQTGSGKTYTMFGPPSPDVESRGVASRVGEAVLAAAAERRRLGLDVAVSVSYVEVFGNDVTDLLAAQPAASNYSAVRSTLLGGGFDRAVESLQDLEDAMALGDARKRSASTAMNERSTRAHTLLVFRLVQRLPGSDQLSVCSQLYLADLGGSERVTKSHANEDAKSAGFVPWEEYYQSRVRITETKFINQGLLSLKRCIQALGERQNMAAASAGNPPVVPFRDSGLTALLEPALGGLARTTMIVCCSPEACHAEETVQTLRFGEVCSRIEHVSNAASDPSAAVARALKQIDDEVADVEQLIREKERWEWRQRVRKDVVNVSDAAVVRVNTGEQTELGGYGAVEVLPDAAAELTEVEHKVWGQVLVGAEAERERLEVLLNRRRQLLGEA